jgi:hypothetical protein
MVTTGWVMHATPPKSDADRAVSLNTAPSEATSVGVLDGDRTLTSSSEQGCFEPV